MPVEHEFKFIVKNATELRERLNNHDLSDDVEWGWVSHIEQFYVSENARFRHTREKIQPYVFTYKQMIDGKLLEIETDVLEADFELGKLAKTTGLIKERYVIFDKNDYRWEIDFLLTETGEVYFSLFEVETEPTVTSMTPPAFLAPYVELAVPREHSIFFTNQRLSDQAYAAEVMKNYRQ